MCIAILYLIVYVKLENRIPALRAARRRALKALAVYVSQRVRPAR